LGIGWVFIRTADKYGYDSGWVGQIGIAGLTMSFALAKAIK